VSATVPRAPDPTQLADEELPLVLDQFDARQILHVTFGSVATAVDDQGQPQFARRLRDQLEANRTAYWDGLRAHFARHLQPFTQTA
jgi:hypothetical protein